MNGNKKKVVLAIILIVVLAGLSMAMIYAFFPMAGERTPTIAKLDLTLPKGTTISSASGYGDMIVLCGYNESLYVQGMQAFFLLSYSPGDVGFQKHSVQINYIPMDGTRTSLNVINGSLYLEYTAARGGDYTSYNTYLKEIHVNNWTLGEEVRVKIPPLLEPGVSVSDGKNLYIIGGVSSNITQPYLPFILTDDVYRINVTTGQTHLMATIPNASGMHGVFLGGKLITLFRAGDFNGPEQNFLSSVLWNSTAICDLDNGTVFYPPETRSLSTPGTVPSADGSAAYFFNPMNTTSDQWNYTHKILRMDAGGSLSKVDLLLPDPIQYVIPIHYDRGFFLISMGPFEGTTFWRCTL